MFGKFLLQLKSTRSPTGGREMLDLKPVKIPQDKLEKLARMAHAGVGTKQLSNIVGLTESKLEVILKSDEFNAEIAKIESEAFENLSLMNQGWDGIEEKAMSQVLNHLSNVPDPDYALKAAVVANKAQRRGTQHQNAPIQIQPNLQTVIELNVDFVNQLQQSFSVSERQVKELPLKDTNMLSVKGVQSKLGLSKDINDYEIHREFDDDLDAALDAI